MTRTMEIPVVDKKQIAGGRFVVTDCLGDMSRHFFEDFEEAQKFVDQLGRNCWIQERIDQ
ncbi:MAG: hypothetical protein OXI24_19230 [Candidatus Poribacteria bacterium]|nr:hypothetical protein [Candidatus Poribacteria bacterium]